MEGGESFADVAGERDDLLALVAVERFAPGGDRLVAAACGFERLGEAGERVTLPVERVRALDDLDCFQGEPLCLGA